jgi:hypothetical protein
MKDIGKILQYLVPYWRKGLMNISLNFLSAVFALFSVGVAIPFLGILFRNEPAMDTAGSLNSHLIQSVNILIIISVR